MAVLFRVNAASPTLEQALADRGIPYLVRGGERFYERPEVRQALLALRTQARAVGGVEEAVGQEAVDHVKSVLATLGWTPQPPNSAGTVRERWESLAALVSVAEDLVRVTAGEAEPRPEPATSRLDLSAISAELDRRAEAQYVPAAQGVTLGTVHAAKGLEWEAVALYGVHEGSLPFVLATTDEEIAEERRLLYVGITRARHRLRISWSQTRAGGGPGRRPSRFLEPVLPASLALVSPSRSGRRAPVLAHCRACGLPLTGGTDRKLGRHAGCPSTYDEHALTRLKEWRRQEAAEQHLPAFCIFTDATLVALAEVQPVDSDQLARIPGLGRVKIDRYGEQLLAILSARAGTEVH